MDWASLLSKDLPPDVEARLGSGLCEAVGNPVFWDRPRPPLYMPSGRQMHSDDVLELHALHFSVTSFDHECRTILKVSWHLDQMAKWWLRVSHLLPESLRQWLRRVENHLIAVAYDEGWTYEPLGDDIQAVVDDETHVLDACGDPDMEERVGKRNATESVQPHLLNLFVQQAVFEPWRLIRLRGRHWRLVLRVREMKLGRLRKRVSGFDLRSRHDESSCPFLDSESDSEEFF